MSQSNWPMGRPVALTRPEPRPPLEDRALEMARPLLRTLQTALAVELRAAGDPLPTAPEDGLPVVLCLGAEDLDTQGACMVLVGLLLPDPHAPCRTSLPMYGRCLLPQGWQAPAMRVFGAVVALDGTAMWAEATVQPLAVTPTAVRFDQARPCITLHDVHGVSLQAIQKAVKLLGKHVSTLPRVPGRIPEFRQWVETWKAVERPWRDRKYPGTGKPLRGTYKELSLWLKNAKPHLACSPETLADVIRAGEFGLLDRMPEMSN